MKKKIFSLLVLLAAAVSGTWAQDADNCPNAGRLQKRVAKAPRRVAANIPSEVTLSFSCTSGYQYGVASDGEYIYVSSWSGSSSSMFYKYGLDGSFIEEFNISGCGYCRDMTYDGTYFYGVANGNTIYQIDFESKTVVGTINIEGMSMRGITYDPVRDGFWVVGNWAGPLALYDRNGTKIQEGIYTGSVSGMAYYEDNTGEEHILQLNNNNNDVYDYNITTNTNQGVVFNLNHIPGATGSSGGCFIGDYKGQVCMFADVQQSPNLIGIFPITNAKAAVYSTANAAIDVNVPEGLGQMTPETAGQTTDLYYFLQSYLHDSPLPAYIKLTLKGGAEYECSQPMEITSAFELVGDDEDNLPTIMAYNGLVKIGDKKPGDNFKDANGFYTTIYNLAFKNINVSHLWYNDLFSTAGKKYRIPYVTFENCVIDLDNYYSALNFKGGGVAENITMTRSTFGWATIYNAQGGSLLSAAGVNKQTFDISYCDFYRIYSDALLFASTAADEAGRVSINFHHNIVVGNYSYYIQDLVQCLNIPGAYMSLIQYNAFQSDQFNGICTDWSSIAEQYGAAASVKGNMVMLKSAYNDQNSHKYNLSLGACPQRDAQIGDPRWLSTLMRVKAGSAQFDDDNDLAKVINKGVENGFTEFELLQNQYGNARYYLKQPIVADKAISIVAADKNIQIDASQNNGALIQLSKTPAVAFMPKADGSGVTDYYGIQQVLLKDLNITGIKQSILYDNNTKYCVVDMTIDNCVLGLETEQVDNEALISMQAGGIKDFNMMNSTVYGNNAVAKYFIRYNNSARLDRYGFDKNTEFQTMTYQNNTFYGLLKSDGQWGNYNGIAGQNYSKFVVEKNIWYNSSNEIIRRMAGGRFGGNAPQTFDKNTYFLNGADNSAKEAGYDKSGTALTTDPGFKDAANGDFTLSAYSAQCNEQTGDPRWFAEGGHYNPVTGIETVKTAEETSLENAVIYNLNGQRVEKAQKGLYIVNGKKVVIK